MIAARLLLLLGCLTLSAMPLSAFGKPADFQQAMEQAQKAAEKSDPKKMLAAADKAVRLAPGKPNLGRAHFLRMAAFVLADRADDAVAAGEAAIKNGPEEAEFAQLLFKFGVDVGYARIAQLGADRLLNAFPADARGLNATDYYDFVRSLRKHAGSGAVDDYMVRFAAVGLGEEDVGFRDSVAYAAVKALLARGDAAQAEALAGRMTDVRQFGEMLTLRTFEPLWPKLEKRVGPNMNIVADAGWREAEAALNRRPADFVAQKNYLHTALMAGKLAEGDKVAAAFAATPEAMAGIEERGGWLIDEHAMLLRAQRRQDAADARYAALRVIKIEEKPWLISMIINRAEFLVRDGNHAKAAPLVAEAEKLTQTYGSAYARQLIRRMKLCSAAATGASTAELLAPLTEHATDSRGVTAEGLLCINKPDEAARFVIAELEDKDGRDSMVYELQPPGTVRDGDPSVWRANMYKLLDRPDVRAAFDKVGRVMPAEFWPKSLQ